MNDHPVEPFAAKRYKVLWSISTRFASALVISQCKAFLEEGGMPANCKGTSLCCACSPNPVQAPPQHGVGHVNRPQGTCGLGLYTS